MDLSLIWKNRRKVQGSKLSGSAPTRRDHSDKAGKGTKPRDTQCQTRAFGASTWEVGARQCRFAKPNRR